MPRLLLDISRTFARAHLPAQTGIDRVETAYFNWAARQDALFLIRVPGRDVIADARCVRAALAVSSTSKLGALAGMNGQQAQLLKLAILQATPKLARGFTYMNVGHSNLKARVLDRLKKLGMAQFVAMLHDVIPLDHPEACRTDQLPAIREKMALIAARADAVITVSRDSAARLRIHLAKAGRVPEILVAAPGVQTLGTAAPASRANFVAIGTVEPRKNISFLLDVWEQLGRFGPTPDLHIVGRRGWEEPAVLARLDAAKATNPCIFEHNACDDADLARHLAQAWALLFPTQCEGFGIPLYEARAMGVHTLATDLPVLREHGQALTQFLPLEVEAWVAAIQGMERPVGAACAAVPTWDAHFAAIAPVLSQPAMAMAS